MKTRAELAQCLAIIMTQATQSAKDSESNADQRGFTEVAAKAYEALGKPTPTQLAMILAGTDTRFS